MIKRIYVYLIIVISLFFSFSLDVNAESYIVEPYSEENIKSSCSESGEINFSCGDFKKIRSCKSIPIEIGECNMTASDEYCIKTHIFIYEIGYFEFGHISSVYAGMGFNFPNVSYKRNVYWDYYRSEGGKIKLLDARKGLKSSGIRLSESEIENYKGDLDSKADGAFKSYLDSYGKTFLNDNIMVKAYDSNTIPEDDNDLVEVKGTWEKINPDNEIEVIKVIEDGEEWKILNPQSISIELAGENLFIKDLNQVQVGKKGFGNWVIFDAGDSLETTSSSYSKIENGEISGISQKFVYNFCDAYINLSGPKFSDVEYKCDDVVLGEEYSGGYSKYFVPLLFLDDPDTKEVKEKFKFNIDNINSVDNYLNISGTCDIDVVDGLFGYGEDNKIEPRYSYRPIDVDNPFPDNNVAYNWRKAVNWEFVDAGIKIDFSRIRKSYENGFYYKVVLVNGDSTVGEISVNSIDNVNYNDWSNISYNGKSSFVDDDRVYKNNAKSYCEIGRFDATCDVYGE